MMKIKVKDITNKQMNYICKKNIQTKCQFCPLKRFRKDGKTTRELLYCWKNLRAWSYANIEWYKTQYTGKEENKQLLIDAEITYLHQIENEEIEIMEELV